MDLLNYWQSLNFFCVIIHVSLKETEFTFCKIRFFALGSVRQFLPKIKTNFERVYLFCVLLLYSSKIGLFVHLILANIIVIKKRKNAFNL